MPDRIPVTTEEIAREFRLLRLNGNASEAITNPAIRICLTACAELRKRGAATTKPAEADMKRRAAGDTE
jgi:hypothetical protein